jgi:catechol 2,3-dioxygenase-like lactoylglutathione lyase family enzyme
MTVNDGSNRRIRLVRIAHVYYTHKDIDKARRFLDDFGFREVKQVGKKIYYAGYGPDPFVYCAEAGHDNEFGGASFEVESRDDLEYAARTLPDATAIYELTDAPGGRQCVTFKDPSTDSRFTWYMVRPSKRRSPLTRS